jgi:hypothetical protein
MSSVILTGATVEEVRVPSAGEQPPTRTIEVASERLAAAEDSGLTSAAGQVSPNNNALILWTGLTATDEKNAGWLKDILSHPGYDAPHAVDAPPPPPVREQPRERPQTQQEVRRSAAQRRVTLTRAYIGAIACGLILSIGAATGVAWPALQSALTNRKPALAGAAIGLQSQHVTALTKHVSVNPGSNSSAARPSPDGDAGSTPAVYPTQPVEKPPKALLDWAKGWDRGTAEGQAPAAPARPTTLANPSTPPGGPS